MKSKRQEQASTLAALIEQAQNTAKKAPPPLATSMGTIGKMQPVASTKSDRKENNLAEMMNWLAKPAPSAGKAPLPKVDLALSGSEFSSKNLPKAPEKMLVRYNDVYNNSKAAHIPPPQKNFGFEPPRASAQDAVLRAIEDDWNSDAGSWDNGITKLTQREAFSMFTEPKQPAWSVPYMSALGIALAKNTREQAERQIIEERLAAPYGDEVLAAVLGDWKGYEYRDHFGEGRARQGQYMDEVQASTWDGWGGYSYEKPWDKLDLGQMQSVLTETQHHKADSVTKDMAADLNRVLYEYNITTPQQIQFFLATAMHESRTGLTEGETEPEDYVRDFCKRYEPGTEGGRLLGNTEVGDGYLFRGAGYIQVTGRYNYQEFSNYIKEKYGYDPRIMAEGAEYVAEMYPWEASGWYWDKLRNVNRVIERGNENGKDAIDIFLQASNAVFYGLPYESEEPDGWGARQARLDNVMSVY